MNPSQPPQGQIPPSADSPVQPSQEQQPNPYAANPANAYPQQQPHPGFPIAPPADGFAITSMVLGIIAVVTCYFGGIPGLIAVIFGHLALNKINRNPHTVGGKGMAIAGLVTGYIGIAFSTIVIILFAVGITTSGVAINEFGEGFQRGLDKQEQERKEQESQDALDTLDSEIDELILDQE